MDQVIDAHVHVGLVGDRWPKWGKMSEWYRRQIAYRIFLRFARVDEDRVCDTFLRDAFLEAVDSSGVGGMVCLALDPVYDDNGNRREDLSHVWVDNDYVVRELRPAFPRRILLGASVHPYDPRFAGRVRTAVDDGAVLLKWLPSAQHIDLADDRVGNALVHLATAGPGGRPLPLLLHVGVEYAIPTSDPRTQSYDFLGWSWQDNAANWFRGRRKWHVPRIREIHANLRRGLEAGAIIIFAHCGLPYVASGLLGRFAEHSDFDAVRDYLTANRHAAYPGRCYADVSACCTPFRKRYFGRIAELPAEYLLYGSDYPTPAFEISAGKEEILADLKAVLAGHLDRAVIPEENLLDVNLRELRKAFGGHPMFTNAARLFGHGG